MTKNCNICNLQKELTEFDKYKTGTYRKQCRRCRYENYGKKHRKSEKFKHTRREYSKTDKFKEYQKEYQKTDKK